VDAIYGTGVDAGVLWLDAGFGNDTGHEPTPITTSTVCLTQKKFK
jgi:hypothetical protein